MTWLVEDPQLIVYAGLALAAVVVVVLMAISRRAAIQGFAGMVALVVLLLVVERLVVTEVERVEAVLYGVTDALNRNDANAVLALVSPSATKVRDAAADWMRRLTVREAKITSDLKITVNEQTDPPSARASFIGRLAFELHREQSPYNHIVRRFVIKLVRDGDRWLIADYEDADL